uniref:Uncharacterized protein n=1 Tax=Rhizophora mucronata TaxID=61149 RepID=A0A2P2LRS9_RHIMU
MVTHLTKHNKNLGNPSQISKRARVMKSRERKIRTLSTFSPQLQSSNQLDEKRERMKRRNDSTASLTSCKVDSEV